MVKSQDLLPDLAIRVTSVLYSEILIGCRQFIPRLFPRIYQIATNIYFESLFLIDSVNDSSAAGSGVNTLTI